jgi:arylsulfatase A-like enzyme
MRQNLLLVTVDALRRDALGCMGSTGASTPHLDALADSGVLFDQAIANGPRTQTSFPSIMCSLYPLVAGERRGLPASATTLAEAVNGAGYATAGFNPSNPFLTRETGYDRGFELFIDFWDVHDRRGSGARKGVWTAFKNAFHDALGRRSLGALMLFQAAVLPEGGQYLTGGQITEQGLQWVAAQDHPFFLWLHYMDVHYPYQPLPGERTWRDRLSCLGCLAGMTVGRPAPAVAALRRLYDRRVELVDRHIGNLLDGLDALDLSRETAVIVTSDHGEQLGERGRFAHGPDLHDELLRVPLIIRNPGLGRRGKVSDQVELLDLAPTILDLLGIAAPETFMGSSFLPLMRGERIARRACAFSESMHGGGRQSRTGVADVFRVMSCRAGGFKYIRDDEGPYEELYDLLGDPGETENLVRADPRKASEMRSLVEAHDHLVAGEAARYGGDRERPLVDGDEEIRRRLAALGYL